MKELDKKWAVLIKKMQKQFDEEISLKGILYLIGIQELNFGVKAFERHEKINVLHVKSLYLNINDKSPPLHPPL